MKRLIPQKTTFQALNKNIQICELKNMKCTTQFYDRSNNLDLEYNCDIHEQNVFANKKLSTRIFVTMFSIINGL